METYYYYYMIFRSGPYYYHDVYSRQVDRPNERGLHYISCEFFFNLLTRKVIFFSNWKAIVWKTFVEHIVFAVQDICAQSACAFTAHLQYSPNRIIIISTIACVGIYRYEIIFIFTEFDLNINCPPPPPPHPTPSEPSPVTSRIRLWRSERVVTSYNYTLCTAAGAGITDARERRIIIVGTYYNIIVYSDTANNII